MTDRTQTNTFLFVQMSIFVAAALLTTLPAFAQEQELEAEASTTLEPAMVLEESMPTENQMERRESIEARVEERQETRDERQLQRTEAVAEKRSALQEAAQKRILNLAANISNRMDAVVERLETITERLGSRVTKLEAAGFDTGTAQTQLLTTTQLLNEAKTVLADIDTLVFEATTSDRPKDNWVAVREQYKTAGSLIRQAHQELRLIINQLKVAVPKPKATSMDLTEEMAATEGTIITSE